MELAVTLGPAIGGAMALAGVWLTLRWQHRLLLTQRQLDREHRLVERRHAAYSELVVFLKRLPAHARASFRAGKNFEVVADDVSAPLAQAFFDVDLFRQYTELGLELIRSTSARDAVSNAADRAHENVLWEPIATLTDLMRRDVRTTEDANPTALTKAPPRRWWTPWRG
jgi:hypothetical protein